MVKALIRGVEKDLANGPGDSPARDGNGIMHRGGGPMKKFRLLMLTMLATTATLANTREWKIAMVVDASETDVSGEVRGKRNIMHYTMETDDMIYLVEYTYKPGQHNNNHAPDIAVNVQTKIAIEGKHAYILDVTGKEVKLHIVKKTTKK
jgi:hypothetical protein